MATPRVLVIAGYGLNCEEETLFAFERAGISGSIIHINDLIADKTPLTHHQILAIPGGFSYGDDTGSGNALANRIRNNLWEELHAFLERDTLTLGLCNGCQTLVNLGLVPGSNNQYGEREVALLHNSSHRYQCRWVTLNTHNSSSPWLKNIGLIRVPVAHGEGCFTMSDDTLATLQTNGQIAFTYSDENGNPANGIFPANPNGSMADIAAITSENGRVLAMMPHPERAILFTQQDNWPLLAQRYTRNDQPLPEDGDGMALFSNAAAYFA